MGQRGQNEDSRDNGASAAQANLAYSSWTTAGMGGVDRRDECGVLSHRSQSTALLETGPICQSRPVCVSYRSFIQLGQG